MRIHPAASCCARRRRRTGETELGLGLFRQAGGDERQIDYLETARQMLGIQPGGGRIGACMRENASKLSEGCKKAIQDNRSSLPATQTGQTGAAQPPSGDIGPAQETTPPATQE